MTFIASAAVQSRLISIIPLLIQLISVKHQAWRKTFSTVDLLELAHIHIYFLFIEGIFFLLPRNFFRSIYFLLFFLHDYQDLYYL